MDEEAEAVESTRLHPVPLSLLGKRQMRQFWPYITPAPVFHMGGCP